MGQSNLAVQEALPPEIHSLRQKNGNIQEIKVHGYIRIKDGKIYLSDAFFRLSIALAESQDDGFLGVIYRDFRIATINTRDGISIIKKITVPLTTPLTNPQNFSIFTPSL